MVNIEIRLSTLANLDDHPAIITGLGPVLADVARQVALEQTDAQWRYSVVDSNGNLRHHGITKRRPSATESAYVRARDKTCIAPGCLQTAAICDLDHRTERWDLHLTDADSSGRPPATKRPKPGVDYPRSTAQFRFWFGSDEDCLDYPR